MNSETKADFKALFKYFFDIMGSEPKTMITDQQIAIGAALEDLKIEKSWSGSHFLDTFHILKNLRKRIKQDNMSGLFACLHDAMFEKSKWKYQKLIEQARAHCKNDDDRETLSNFIKLASKYCISQTPVGFHGVMLSTSFHERANDLIKSYLSLERPIAFVVKKTIKILNEMQYKSK